jgi:hypothetical protein
MIERTFTKDQTILLLYLECMAVEGGTVDMWRMNADDMRQAVIWNDIGFIGFGRICASDIQKSGSHWVRFTDNSFSAAHRMRQERADRLWGKRAFETTEEKRLREVHP